MAQFFDSFKAVLSPEFVIAVTTSYVINELNDVVTDSAKRGYATEYVTDGGEELIGKLVEYSNHRLRLYGSARELAENVNIFYNTPGTWRRFHSHGYRVYPYYITPIIFKSLKDEEYIYKQDVYLILQNMTLEACPFEKSPVLRVLIAMLLRFQDYRNFPKAEFVKFDANVFEEINEEVKGKMKHVKIELSQRLPTILNLSDSDFPQLCEKFRDLIPIKWDEYTRDYFQCVLSEYVRDFANSPHLEILITTVYNVTGGIVKVVQEIIDNRKEIFKSQESKRITVRLFEDGDEQFVLEAELQDAISRSKKTKSIHKNGTEIIDTMSMEDVRKTYGHRIQNVEFIRTPILRAKHRAVPIQIQSESFSILAADMLFEFLRNVIFGHKVFQRRQKSELFLREFDRFDKLFKSETKVIYVVNTLADQVLNEICTELLDHIENIPAKDVRNAKKDGFTVENLKNELIHLGLPNAFPEIQNHAEVVFSEVDKRKKEHVLRTCDLFDAIEHCQLICLFDRLPKLKKFLHNQKSCHRVIGLNCSICRPSCCKSRSKIIQKPSKPMNRGSKNSEVVSEVRKAPESKKSDRKMTDIVTKTSNCSPHPQKQTTPSTEAPKTSESQNPPKTSETSAPERQKPHDSQNQKTSANCEKCYRACEMLNETKKELKSSENKLKNVEKKMLGKEKEMEELKKKMDEKDKQIQGLNDQFSNLKSSKALVEIEKLRQEEAFQSVQKLLEEHVSRVEKELQMRSMEIWGLEKRFQEKEEENMNLIGHISQLENYMVHNQVEKEKHLEERVFHLEQELREGNENIWELQNQMASDAAQFEAVIQENNRVIEELKESEIRMRAENEVNQRMIQQLMDKLASSGVNNASGFRKSSEVSTTSSRIQKCEICWNEANDREAVRCQKCCRPFHQKCSSQWLKSYKNCPSCHEEFLDSENTHLFSVFSFS